jgi:hypothetical protein
VLPGTNRIQELGRDKSRYAHNPYMHVTVRDRMHMCVAYDDDLLHGALARTGWFKSTSGEGNNPSIKRALFSILLNLSYNLSSKLVF